MKIVPKNSHAALAARQTTRQATLQTTLQTTRRLKIGVAQFAMLLWLATTSAFVAAVELQETAPDFTLKQISGENIRLEEQRGKVVLVNFWASWCGPCRQEMPVLDRIQARYAPMGFTVLGVNVDEDASSAQRVIDRLSVQFPLLRDEAQTVSKLYDVNAMPFSVLIGQDGNVEYIHKGYKPGDEKFYVDHVRRLLRGSR